MPRYRIHEAARECNLPSSIVLEYCSSKGYDAKSYMSAISEEEYKDIINAFSTSEGVKRVVKNRIMANIYALAKLKDMKIGEVEELASISKGYISKLNGEGNKALPAIDTLISIAGVFEVSLDFLVSADASKVDEKDLYLIDFIHKLSLDTETRSIDWAMESGSYLTTELRNNRDSINHPLFSSTPSVIEHPQTGNLIDIISNYYQSRFLEDNDIKAFHNSYKCEFGNAGEILYMMKFEAGDDNYDDYRWCSVGTSNKPEIELYIVNEDKEVIPLCSTYTIDGGVDQAIRALYETVAKTSKGANLTTETKSIIDRYMKKK